MSGDYIIIPSFPKRWNGTDAAGHRVYATALAEDIERGDLSVKCEECNAFVTAKWDTIKLPMTIGHVEFKSVLVPVYEYSCKILS